MHDDVDRLSEAIDRMAAERNPLAEREFQENDRARLRTAALIRAGSLERLNPREEFVEGLASRIHAMQQSSTAAAAPALIVEPKGGVTRKSAILRAAAAVAALAAGGAGLATVYEHGKNDGSEQEASSTLTANMVPADRGIWLSTGHSDGSITPGSAARFRAGALEGFLVRPAPGSGLYALSAVCTHMGCMLSWVGSTDTFLCPCHGAQYNADGTVLSGIARHPLPKLRVKVESDGGIYVWTVAEHPAVTTLEPYNRAVKDPLDRAQSASHVAYQCAKSVCSPGRINELDLLETRQSRRVSVRPQKPGWQY